MILRYNGQLCNFLGTISNPKAFRIVSRLLKRGSLSFTQLEDELDLSKSTLRTQLGKLTSCSYVLKRGKKPIKYGINRKIVVPLLKLMQKHLDDHNKRKRG